MFTFKFILITNMSYWFLLYLIVTWLAFFQKKCWSSLHLLKSFPPRVLSLGLTDGSNPAATQNAKQLPLWEMWELLKHKKHEKKHLKHKKDVSLDVFHFCMNRILGKVRTLNDVNDLYSLYMSLQFHYVTLHRPGRDGLDGLDPGGTQHTSSST